MHRALHSRILSRTKAQTHTVVEAAAEMVEALASHSKANSAQSTFFLLSASIQTLHAESFQLVDGDVVGLLPGHLLLLEGHHLGLQLPLLLLQLLLGLAVSFLQVVLGVG